MACVSVAKSNDWLTILSSILANIFVTGVGKV